VDSAVAVRQPSQVDWSVLHHDGQLYGCHRRCQPDPYNGGRLEDLVVLVFTEWYGGGPDGRLVLFLDSMCRGRLRQFAIEVLGCCSRDN
jgi:hypothetical protein